MCSNPGCQSLNQKEAGCHNPQLLSGRQGSPYLDPYLESSTSPLINVPGSEVWTPGSEVWTPGNNNNPEAVTDSVLHRSSHVSFGDSLTDDSEAVHQLDLSFDGLASSDKETKRMFEAYVDDLLECYSELNFIQEEVEVETICLFI